MHGVCGLILAGGTGSRLSPATRVVNKHLLCLYDKPVIYYPISTLMLAGIRDICIICTPESKSEFQKLLSDGKKFGVKFSYIVQPSPRGIAEAYSLARDFINGRRSVLMLGDNILFGDNLGKKIKNCIDDDEKNYLFGCPVLDPKPYGVISYSADDCVTMIEEKPLAPKSNLAAVGLYILNADACSLVNELRPSSRSELEITDLLNLIKDKYNLRVSRLGRGYTWLDTGTPDGLLAAANLVATIQDKQGYLIGCIEEVANLNGWVSEQQKTKLKNYKAKSSYDIYLKNLYET